MKEIKTFEELQKEFTEGVTLVDFYATWCNPCKMLMLQLEQLEQEENVKILKVDVEEGPELAGQFEVMSVPTLIFFLNGDMKFKSIGFQSKEQLQELIGKVV
ncbi:thioredoxin family protein [Fredinandcohnia humi]